tara:strand:+ start:786 stop:1559 length:774 start_codon:yes stop_codon:yes gene_type:complete
MGTDPSYPSLINTEFLSPIGLEEMNKYAKLQTRVDRKYIVKPETCNELLRNLPINGRALEINGYRSTQYQSTYFDTPSLDLHKAAAYQRRPRFKARTRYYEQTDIAMLEVKTKDGRGKTVKTRTQYDSKSLNSLTKEARQFIRMTVNDSKYIDTLRYTLTTQYQRTTIVDLDTQTRMTCDEFLTCIDWENNTISLPMIILETKSSIHPSPFDTWLWGHHYRPNKVSKYCTTLAVLHPDLPSNKWHSTIKKFFLAPVS